MSEAQLGSSMPKANKAKKKPPSSTEINTLVQACLAGETANALAILKRGAPVDAQDSAGNHALGAASCGGHVELVKKLLDADAPLELKNQIGTTPLWLAAGYGHEGVLDLLIARGADINEGNTTMDTPMLAAAAKRHTGCVERLVAAGARHLTVNNGGDSPLSLAVSDSNLPMAKVLLSQPGGPMLIGRKNKKGVHPMAAAAAGGNAPLVQLLLDHGGSDTATDANGATPLALAAFCGAAEVVKLLVKRTTVDIEAKDKSGATPLWLGAAAGHLEAVQVLIEAGANPHVASGGHEAADAAGRNGHPKVKALLTSCPAQLTDTALPADNETKTTGAPEPERMIDSAQAREERLSKMSSPSTQAAGNPDQDDAAAAGNDGIPDFEGDFDIPDGEEVFDPARGKDYVYQDDFA